jgi:hypothetical protein
MIKRVFNFAGGFVFAWLVAGLAFLAICVIGWLVLLLWRAA